MFKPINALSIAISLSLVVVMQPQALSGTVGAITSWGRDNYDQVSNTPTGTDFAAIAGGFGHSLALKSDGSIISWGRDVHNQVTNTPSDTGFTHIAAGYHHGLAFTIPEPHTLLLASLASMGLDVTPAQERARLAIRFERSAS